ncbi:MAG: phosphotransferase [Thermaerobacter sp.]|nr:phosphotransferase [Thermaerobacter sp.]
MDWEHAVTVVRPGWERRHGAAGRCAAHDLPDRVAMVATSWDLTVLGPLATGWESVVVAVHDVSGQPGVLKCRPPADPGTRREAVVLTRLASPGLVPLIASAPDEGVLWLGRVVPGHALSQELDDQAAVDAWCQVASSLPRVVPDPEGTGASTAPFPTLDHQLGALEVWQATLSKGQGRLAQWVVAVAHRLAASTRDPSLLHGDLHDENILAAGGGAFYAIDPKGVWGDPAYEPACFLMNRWMRSSGPSERMAGALAERLLLDGGRVLGWTLVHTALSLAWSQEDDGVAAPATDSRWTLLRHGARFIGGWKA